MDNEALYEYKLIDWDFRFWVIGQRQIFVLFMFVSIPEKPCCITQKRESWYTVLITLKETPNNQNWEIHNINKQVIGIKSIWRVSNKEFLWFEH